MTITGHKHTNKDILAKRLAENSDIEFVRPYTARELPNWGDADYLDSEFNVVLPNVLEDMMSTEKVLSVTEIGDNKYVFFDFQFREPYSVVVVDDCGVISIKDNWDGKVFTIRIVSSSEEKSERVDKYLNKHEFDAIFDFEKDDLSELEHLIGEYYD